MNAAGTEEIAVPQSWTTRPVAAPPIFVVGAPRSGTTLLRSIIDAHPNICCPTWETAIFETFAQMFRGDVNIGFAEGSNFPITRDELLAWCRRSADELMGMLTRGTGKPRWAEKTPAHVFHLGLIHDVYPDAQFIHIIRNGRDTVRSLQSMPWAPRQIRWSCRRWVQSVQAGREAGRQLPPAQYMEVRYEDLISAPEPKVKAVCEFLNETYYPSMLEFHKPQNNSWGMTAAPLDNKPVNKHRPLSWRERWTFQRIGGPLLRELGYR